MLIVGAGPSGLSAAWHLARLGHEVEIREAVRCPAACCISASPPIACRAPTCSPRSRRIEQMGVRIVLNCKVTDVLAERDTGSFDAVFVAIGAHVGKHADIPARDAMR